MQAMNRAFLVCVVFLLAVSTTYGVPRAGAPISLLSADPVGNAVLLAECISGVTFYTATINALGLGTSQVSSFSGCQIVWNANGYQGLCATATYTYQQSGVTSDISETGFFCLPGMVQRLAGGGAWGAAQGGYVDGPNDVALFSGLSNPVWFTNDMYVVDKGNKKIRVISFDGVISTIPVDYTMYTTISSIAVGSSSALTMYFVDHVAPRNILQYTAGVTTVVANLGCNADSTNEKIDIVLTTGTVFYIASGMCQTIYKFDASSNTVTVLVTTAGGMSDGMPGVAGFLYPGTISYDQYNSLLYVGDNPPGRGGAIRVINLSNQNTTTVAGKLNISLDGVPKQDGPGWNSTFAKIVDLYYDYTTGVLSVADYTYDSIRCIDNINYIVTTAMGHIVNNATDPAPQNNVKLYSPTGVGLDQMLFLTVTTDFYQSTLVAFGTQGSSYTITGLTVNSVGYTNVTLSWSETNFAAFMNYTVTFTPGNIVKWSWRRQGAVFTGLLPNTSYTASVTTTSVYGGPPAATITFKTTTPVCGNGVVEPGEDCETGACCTSQCKFSASTVVCNPAADVCDVAEYCTGSTNTCPTNLVQPNTVVCRNSTGPCMFNTTCDGTNTACPAASYQPSTYECRPSGGPCDIAETCDGSTAPCPTDVKQSSGYVCHAAVDTCDIAETCDGSTDACPTDVYQASGFVCRPTAGGCDVAETCSGSSPYCPTDAVESSGYVCHTATGLCDTDLTCDGSSAQCPAITYQASGYVCRPSGGDCDPQEVCNGTSPDCPTDTLEPSGHVCRPVNGDCDVAETCDGSAPTCPTDGYQASGYVCHAATDLCDMTETCSGSSPACPPDANQPSGYVCRPATDLCDMSETCNGSSTACPPDEYEPSGHVCRPATDLCDKSETCDGTSTACPTDVYQPSGYVCHNATDLCDMSETCDGTSTACPADQLQPSGHVCRPVNGGCDVAETCDGSVASCPADGYQASGYVCHSATDLCDMDETCDGSSPACPADQYQPSGHVCRPAAGDCDLAEMCDGTTVTCPPDVLEPSGHVCRAVNGSCDVQETCDGTTTACPTDSYQPSGYVCRPDSGNGCDVAETCDGTSNECPTDAFKPSGYICHASTDLCDANETCSGTSDTCPPDGYLPGGTVCRPSLGDCDESEVCSGTTPSCPVDQLLPSTNVCRPSAGSCDIPENCTGSSPTCPTDSLRPSGYVCNPSAGICDVEETCDGSSSSCPTDAFLPSTHVCNPSAGYCDIAENCTGSTATCPPDAYEPSGTVCRPSGGICDSQEVCDGSSPACPTDIFLPSTITCRNSSGPCDIAENCTGSGALCPTDGFVASGTVCAAAAGDCDIPAQCDGTTAPCPSNPLRPSTYVCRAANGSCDVAENCTGSTAFCPSNTFLPSTTVCRGVADLCDVAETCDGTSGACPADAYQPSTHECRVNAGECDLPSYCLGNGTACPPNALQPSTHVCRPAASTDLCDVAETCTGTTAQCPTDTFLANGTTCRSSAGPCDVVEVCTGLSPSCPVDAFLPSTYMCNNASGACDVSDYCSGTDAVCVDNVESAGTQCAPPIALCYQAHVCDGTTKVCPIINQPVICGYNGTCNATTGACTCPNGNPFPYCNEPPYCQQTNTCECPSGQYGANCLNCTCVNGVCADGRLGNGSCTCATNWAGVNCELYRAPVVLSAIFTNNAMSIVVLFDLATNQTGSGSCSGLFSSATVAILGVNTVCSWDSSTQLSIRFKSGDTTVSILPRQSLVLQGGVIGYALTASLTSTGSVTVQPPASPDPVWVTLSGPSVVGSCNAFDVAAQIVGVGGRLPVVAWSLVDNGSPNISYYSAELLQLAGTSNYTTALLHAPAEFLQPGNTYIIMVVATNFLGIYGRATLSIQRSSLPTPTVDISEPTPLMVFRSSDIVLRGSISSNCLMDQTANWSWTISYADTNTQVYIPGLVENSDELLIPKFSLAANKNYTVTLNGFYLAAPELANNDSISLQVGVQSLVVVISGGSVLTQPANTTLILNASSSYDPDCNGINPNLTFSWASKVIYGNPLNITSPNSPALVIPPNTAIVNASYLFTCTVTDGAARASSATIQVNIIPTGAPVVSITLGSSQPFRSSQKLVLQGSVTGFADLSSVVYSWTETTGKLNLNNVALTALTAPNLVIAANSLLDSVTYTFQLTASASTGVGQAQFSIAAAPLPQGGIFTVTPQTGVALSTQFSLSCNGWQSFDGSSPLYTFYYMIDGVKSMLGLGQGFNPTITAQLPSPNTSTNALTLIASISDAYGGVSSAQTTVVVLGTNMTHVSETLNNVLDSYNTTDVGEVLQGLVVTTSQINALGGTLTSEQSNSILQITNTTATTNMTTDATVQVAQLLASVAATSPASVVNPLYVTSLKKTATASTNTESSRQSIMDSVSTVVGLAGTKSVNNSTTWYDESYSTQIMDILNSVQISATSQLVCGERTSYYSANVQMVSGRDFPQSLEGHSLSLGRGASGDASLQTIAFPDGLFEALNNTPSCVNTQYLSQLRSILEWSLDTDPPVRLVSNVTTLTLWDESTPMAVENVPPITIVIPFVDYTPSTCAKNATQCESIKCVFWNPDSHEWSKEGCTATSTAQSYVSCQCSHLTDFALRVTMEDAGLGDTIAIYGKIPGNPWAIILVCSIYAIYCVAIFSMWLIDAKQDYEKTPLVDNIDKFKKRRPFELLDTPAVCPPPTPPPRVERIGKTLYEILVRFARRMKKTHRWFSVYFREKRHNYNRIRRTTVVLVTVMTILASNSIFYINNTTYDATHIPSITQYIYALYSSLIAIPLSFLVFALFYKAKERFVARVKDMNDEEREEGRARRMGVGRGGNTPARAGDTPERPGTPEIPSNRSSGSLRSGVSGGSGASGASGASGGSGGSGESAGEKGSINAAEELQTRLTPRIKLMSGFKKYYFIVVHKRWPWWCSRIAYSISAVVILFCGYLATLYGTQFTQTQLNAWFFSSLLGVLQDIFVNQVIVAFVGAVATVLLGSSSWVVQPRL